MAQRRRREVAEKDLQGLKYFNLLCPLLERLQDAGTQRDRAGNRKLFFDQYGALLLLYFFNPVITSLRGLQQASELAKVQRLLGCERNALGSLSEASRVFDAKLLEPLIHELSGKLAPTMTGKEADALHNLCAVDGSLLRALPKMTWALWRDGDHRAAKMHVHFSVLHAAPVQVAVTHGNADERDQLRRMLAPGQLYVIDRGYAEYQLFQDIVDAGSDFIGRLKENAVFRVIEERPLTDAAKAAGVIRDVVVDKLGTDHHKNFIRQPMRIVIVATGKTNADGTPNLLILATSRLDLTAELVALGYKFRWTVELFFRWFKCVLGCRHLLSTDQNGVTIQVYLGIIASLLINLWTGRKPTRRTWEMIQFFFAGWATENELIAHLDKLAKEEH